LCSGIELYIVSREHFSTGGGGAPARALTPKSVSGSKESATITDLDGLEKMVCWVRSIV